MSPVVVALLGPRHVGLVDEPHLALGAEEVRVRTLFSGVSAGTELAAYRGSSPFLSRRWDAASRVFVAGAEPSMQYPVTTWGYEEVGEVVELGPDVAELTRGTQVYGTWGHRSEYIATASFVRERTLPAGADPLVGTFSHIGAIALNGVLDTRVHIGETVAVFGLGVVGQLVAQLLRQSGARVIGIDLLRERRDMARRLGAAEVLDAADGDVALRIKDLTRGRGADVCVEATGSARALHTAIRACAYASRVVALGFYQGEAGGLFLGEEFHHNRIELACSQIGGIAPELQHRWDRQRLVQTFIQLALDGVVRVTELVTERVPYREAAALFARLDESPGSVLQTVLEF